MNGPVKQVVQKNMKLTKMEKPLEKSNIIVQEKKKKNGARIPLKTVKRFKNVFATATIVMG